MTNTIWGQVTMVQLGRGEFGLR
ncbi:MAG: hypothetical protein RLZZ15_360, partial [Verrucomicrobiota bacterium]